MQTVQKSPFAPRLSTDARLLAFQTPPTNASPPAKLLPTPVWRMLPYWNDAAPTDWLPSRESMPITLDDAPAERLDRVRIPWLSPRPPNPHAPSRGDESPFDSPFRTKPEER